MTIELPALRPLGPARISRDPIGAHPAYETLLRDAPTTGCCPRLDQRAGAGDDRSA